MNDTTRYELRQWRGLRGLSQKELGKMTGLSDRTIANYERDTTRFGSARYIDVLKIAKALDIKLENLIIDE